MGGNLGMCENVGYDPIAEVPSIYVREMRKRALNAMLTQMQVEEDQNADTDNMTPAELRDYYDRRAKQRLLKMDPLE